MANLDSRSKRASSIQILAPFILSLVLPDGSVSQGDRQHTAFSYSGILATAPSAVTTPTSRTKAIGGRDTTLTIASRAATLAIPAADRTKTVK